MADAVGLINKYRPQTFDDVYGHKSAVKSMRVAMKKGLARSFLLTGPSGVGKTTLARIAAREAGAISYGDIREIDGATHTGIDAMREILDALSYVPVGDSKAKAIIVDEAHALSKPASMALLKSLEEPPKWLYWFMCTTEATRILPTLRTRLFRVDLKPIGVDALVDLLDEIVDKEKMRSPEKVVDACAAAADGSARQAISNLAMCAELKTSKEVESLLKTAGESKDAVALARALMFSNWKEAQSILQKLGDVQQESVRYVVRSYVRKVVLGTKKESVAGRGVEVLDAFRSPFNAPGDLEEAVGKVLLS